MGFDIYISLNMMMCSITGKPFYHGAHPETGAFAAVYGYPDAIVPEELRKYLMGRGRHFVAYTRQVEFDDLGLNVSVDQFLERYPSWEEVYQSDEVSEETLDSWNEENHNAFKKLLEWCLESGFDYRVSWSY